MEAKEPALGFQYTMLSSLSILTLCNAYN